MNEHQQMITNIKSDILSLYVNSMNKYMMIDQYVEMLLAILRRHFDIHHCCALVYESDILKPLTTDPAKDASVPWALFDTYFASKKVVDIPYILREQEHYGEMTHMMLLGVDQKPYGILLFKATEKWAPFESDEFIEELVDAFAGILAVAKETIDIRLKENQYRKLYNMTDLFHSTMDIDQILQNVLITIKENFPDFEVELILSNDQDRQTTINIKPFDYLSERPSTIEAFVSGDVTTE